MSETSASEIKNWIQRSLAISAREAKSGQLSDYDKEKTRITTKKLGRGNKSTLVALVGAIEDEAMSTADKENGLLEWDAEQTREMCEAVRYYANLDGNGDKRANNSARAAAYFGIKLGIIYQYLVLEDEAFREAKRQAGSKKNRDQAKTRGEQVITRFNEIYPSETSKKTRAYKILAKEFEVHEKTIRRYITGK